MTLKDVASISGCSVSTVSKVFKNSAEISEETKRKVLETAKKVGYLQKATEKKATLGGQRPIVFADIKGEYKEKLLNLTKLFLKYNFTLVYVISDAKKATELSSQIGGWGTVVTDFKTESAENLFAFNGDEEKLADFLKELSGFKPKRIRKNSSAKKLPYKEKTEQEVKKQEDIWLL